MNSLSYTASYNSDICEYQVTQTENGETVLAFSSRFFSETDKFIQDNILIAVNTALTEVDKESSTVTFNINSI